jgi:hypothetical protein
VDVSLKKIHLYLMIADTSELYQVTGDHGCRDTINPCEDVECVVTLVMGARYEVRPVSELLTRMAGDMSGQKTV